MNSELEEGNSTDLEPIADAAPQQQKNAPILDSPARIFATSTEDDEEAPDTEKAKVDMVRIDMTKALLPFLHNCPL